MRILLSAIYPYLFVLLFIVLPFDDYIRVWPNILLIILAVIFPFVVKKEDFRKLKTSPFYLLFIFVLYLLFNALVFNRFQSDFHIVGKILLSLGLTIFSIPINDIQKIKNAIIFSSLTAIVYSVYNFVIITHNLGYFVLGDSSQVVEALLIDRIYLGLLSVISILISFRGINKTYHPLNSYYMGNIAVNIVFIFLIASRISLIALLVVLIVKQFYGRKSFLKIIIGAASIICLAGLLFLIKNKELEHIQESRMPVIISNFIKHSRTYEIRSTTWECAVEMAKNNHAFWTGDGFEATEKKLIDCYQENINDEFKKEIFITNRYNTHNQFLDFYLSAGFFGIFLFIGFFISGFRIYLNDFYPTALFFVFIIYLLFENMFHRQIGAYYIGLIIIMTLIANNENRIKTGFQKKLKTKENEKRKGE